MSIYPVKAREWFGVETEQFETLICLFEYMKCESQQRYRRAIVMHSVPWGCGEGWCSERCLGSGRVYKLDKRQKRKFNRKSKEPLVFKYVG